VSSLSLSPVVIAASPGNSQKPVLKGLPGLVHVERAKCTDKHVLGNKLHIIHWYSSLYNPEYALAVSAHQDLKCIHVATNYRLDDGGDTISAVISFRLQIVVPKLSTTIP